ncbi:MAG: Uncharacterized protein FD165_2875, partial [Gammaproteobacteria bacterium]
MQQQTVVRRKHERLRYLYRNGDVAGVLFSLLYHIVNRFTRVMVFKPSVVAAPALVYAHLDRLRSYRHGLFGAAELLPYAGDPANDLSREFLEYAAAQGDTCYAIFDGDTLASYCWNSNRPTLIERNLYMNYRSGYLYRYKEYTRPSHRGRRLGSYNHAESLRHFATSDVRGFAGYVEVDNYIQYRTLERLNHRFPGFIVVLGRGPTPWIWHSPRARAWGFRVVSSAPSEHSLSSGS